MAFIGLGTCKLYYAYIFVLVLFKFFSDFIEGFNEKTYYNRLQQEEFYDFGSIFSYHPLFQNFIYFFAAIICGIILYIIYLKFEKESEGSNSLERITTLRKKIFGLSIYTGYVDIIITSLIYVLNIMIRSFLSSMRFDAGFWTIEILFIIYLSIIILKVKIGNHQKVTIFILAIVAFIVQIINSFLPKTDHHCEGDEQCLEKHISDNNIYIFIGKKFGSYGYIVLILFLYTIHFLMRDYSWVRLKYLMDVKSKPMFKILLYIGIIGCSLVIIFLLILTKFPCNIIENIKYENSTYLYIDTNEEIDFDRQICGLIDYDNITNKLTFYYDNYNIFFNDYINSNRQTIEIITIPTYFIINIMINFCYVMILKRVDPNAMLVNINFNYLISRMITYIKHDGKEEYLTLPEFILLELCEILAISAYMIYIELIELKFCRLDYHIKKKIQERSIEDIRLLIKEEGDPDDDDEDEDYSYDPPKSGDDTKSNKSKSSI